MASIDPRNPVPKERKRLRGIKGRPPTLEETLRYFAALMRPEVETHPQLAHELGMDERSLHRKEMHEDWALARNVAKQIKPRRESTFGAYVFKQLSPEAQKTWDSIRFWANHKNATQMIERILTPQNTKVKQEVFIHALVCTTFDLTQACRLAGVTRDQLKYWKSHDLEFNALVEEVQWHKKNFFEKAMLDLVAERHPLATIWVNKTVNADRGYSEKIRVEHSVNPDGFNFEDLDLDLDTKRKILDAIRKKRELNGNGAMKALPAPVEAEVVDVEAA